MARVNIFEHPPGCIFPPPSTPTLNHHICTLLLHTHTHIAIQAPDCTTTRGYEYIQWLCKTAPSPTSAPASSESQHGDSFVGDIRCCPGPPRQAHGRGMRWTVSVPAPSSFFRWHHHVVHECTCKTAVFVIIAAAAAACHTPWISSAREEHLRLIPYAQLAVLRGV